MHKRSKLFVAGGVLCLGVAWASLVERQTLRGTRWVPLDLHLRAAAGAIVAQFEVERGGTYGVGIVIARPPQGPDRVKAECLLGFNQELRSPGNAPCADEPVLDVTWSVTGADGHLEVEGVTAGYTWSSIASQAEVERPMGYFIALDETAYKLSIDSKTNSGELTAYNPRIVIQPTGTENKDAMVEDSFLSAVTYGSGVVGIGLLLTGVSLAKRQVR